MAGEREGRAGPVRCWRIEFSIAVLNAEESAEQRSPSPMHPCPLLVRRAHRARRAVLSSPPP